MKPVVRYILGGILVLAFLSTCVFAAVQSRRDRSVLTCEGLEIEFADSLRFLSEDDIISLVMHHYGPYVGQRLDSIKLFRLEEILLSQSSVSGCEAWTTRDGILHLSVQQRNPVVKFCKGRVTLLCDSRGFMFPQAGKKVDGIPVVKGNLPLSVEASYRGEAASVNERLWVSGVLNLLEFCRTERNWRRKVEKEMEVLPGGDICIRLKGGGERFILGSPDDIEEKFSRIEKYLGWIRPHVDEGCYRTVNVKYNKQIICRKDI